MTTILKKEEQRCRCATTRSGRTFCPVLHICNTLRNKNIKQNLAIILRKCACCVNLKYPCDISAMFQAWNFTRVVVRNILSYLFVRRPGRRGRCHFQTSPKRGRWPPSGENVKLIYRETLYIESLDNLYFRTRVIIYLKSSEPGVADLQHRALLG